MVNEGRINMDFYHEQSRSLQDHFNTRRIADRLAGTRRHSELSEWDKKVIARAPMFFLATATRDGRPDCSVKAGDPGFIRTISPNALLYPDYDGNGMFRSLGNIMSNPYVGMLFLELDGERRKLRINGIASVTDDPQLLEQIPGAQLAVRITVLDIFPNCPRYVPEIEVHKLSIYSPRPGYRPPEPEWKNKPDLREYLPGADPSGRASE
jgi:predicted pyridoxine 5'-phosphate oxidase superfamily flavin-nucleotide-binding protein